MDNDATTLVVEIMYIVFVSNGSLPLQQFELCSKIWKNGIKVFNSGITLT